MRVWSVKHISPAPGHDGHITIHVEPLVGLRRICCPGLRNKSLDPSFACWLHGAGYLLHHVSHGHFSGAVTIPRTGHGSGDTLYPTAEMSTIDIPIGHMIYRNIMSYTMSNILCTYTYICIYIYSIKYSQFISNAPVPMERVPPASCLLSL